MTTQRWPRRLAKASVLLICAFAVFLALTWNSVFHQRLWGPPQLKYSQAAYEATRERGVQIVAALERWKAERGEWPVSLTELVPSYMAAIEPPLVGHGKWLYTPTAQGRFELKFFVGPTYECDWYDSADASWHGDR